MIEMYETVDPAAQFNDDMLDIIMLAEKPEKNIPMLPKRGTLDITQLRDSLYAFA
jgi:DNA-directed RNA polymerase